MSVSLYDNYTSVTVPSGNVQLTVNKLRKVIKIVETLFEKSSININVDNRYLTFSKRLTHLRIDVPHFRFMQETFSG